MKHHSYIKMPSGSIVRVEEDRLQEIEHPNAIIINFVLSLVGAFAIGVVILIGLAQ